MTYGFRMYCFDDEYDPQYMRLYIHIEKYKNGSIDIFWWDLDLHAWKVPTQVQIFFYANPGFVDLDAFFDTHGTYATWAYIIQYKYENVVDDILI